MLRFFLFKDERLAKSGTAQHLADGGEGQDMKYEASLEATKSTVRASITETVHPWTAAPKDTTTTTVTEFGIADGEFDIRERPAK